MRTTRAAAAVAAMALLGVALAGCNSGGGGGGKTVQQDSKAPLTVWVDAARLPQAQAYAKAHPDVKITVNSIDAAQGSNVQKISLAEKSGSGVPDIVFDGAPDEVAALTANPINYPLALNSVVSKEVLAGFPNNTISRCSYSGQIYCLGNDEGQTVLWYNKPLFAQWGYTVPTTFDEFQQLGIKLAREHPGYNLGTVNGRYGSDAYFGSSGCPVVDATSPTTVKVDTSSPKCTRVANLIAPLIANGTLSTLDLFDKNYDTQIASGKVIAFVGASWTADFAFKPMTTKSGKAFDAHGKYAAAPMPTWAGETKNWSGAVGGGIWMVSRTTKNAQAAVAMAVAMTTDPAIAKSQTTYPAYGPSADLWLQAKAADSWYAADPSAVLKAAAANVNPADGYVRYETQLLDAYNATIIKNASNMPAALQAWGEQVTAAAKASGYTVTK